MSYLVLQPLTVKTERGTIEIKAGQVVKIPDDRALPLIQAGKLSLADPEQQHTYQERSAIMEHGGGLSKDQADKYAWCREVCMLTAGQREQCEVVTPCPKEAK